MNLSKIFLSLLLSCLYFGGNAQNSPLDLADNKEVNIFFVRHAEKEKDSSPDPELSAIGEKTAERLSSHLEAYKIDAIYSTPYHRTKMTALPLSQRLNQEILIYDPRDPESLVEIIKKNAGKNILIVGHSNTVPMMINFLAKERILETIPEDQYNKLYIVNYRENSFSLDSLIF